MKFLKELKEIYKPKYMVLNIAIAVVYYFIIKYLFSIQENGVSFTIVPIYLVYLLIATTSITFTIAIYSIRNTQKNTAKVSATTISAITAFAAGILGGCGCEAAILFNVLAIFAGIGYARLVDALVADNVSIIFAAMIIINLVVIVYYLNRFSKPGCKVKRRS
jgi:hypothetical protein